MWLFPCLFVLNEHLSKTEHWQAFFDIAKAAHTQKAESACKAALESLLTDLHDEAQTNSTTPGKKVAFNDFER